jgi:hypothetical protein
MPVSRSLVSILRTSRATLSQPRGANPVNRVFGHDRFAARTYATAFERNKPHVNIGTIRAQWYCLKILTAAGTIGHVDHGKVRRLRSSSYLLLTLRRPRLQRLSQNDRRRKATPGSSNMARLTKLPKNESEALPFPLHISNTKPMRGITLTLTVRATLITSKT